MSVLKKPIVTEKANNLSSGKVKHYAFVVDKQADKSQIRAAVESLYGVNVTDVRTMITNGKRKSRYTKTGILSGKVSNVKKAFVTLAEGQEIDFYKNIQ